MDPGAELLHKVCGSLHIARDMIDRSAVLCGRGIVADDSEIRAGLTDAADALSYVSRVLESELRRRSSSALIA